MKSKHAPSISGCNLVKLVFRICWPLCSFPHRLVYGEKCNETVSDGGLVDFAGDRKLSFGLTRCNV